jgi:hypothetical protein
VTSKVKTPPASGQGLKFEFSHADKLIGKNGGGSRKWNIHFIRI